MDAARLSWGRFLPAFDKPPIELRVVVEDSAESSVPGPPAFRAQAGLLAIVADRANFAVCDYERNFSFAFVTSQVVRDTAYFCYHFLEAVAFCTLTHRYLAPVHAAVVARDGRGVLLCGESGAGKSSLSYACARAGWTYLSDNAAFLLRGSPGRQVLGDPHLVRLRADAPRLFPELTGRSAANQMNGKLAIVLETAGLKTAFSCCAERLVFLNRRTGAENRCDPVSPEEAFRRLQDSLPRYDRPVEAEICAALREVAAVPAFEMRYGELALAVQQLESLVAGF